MKPCFENMKAPPISCEMQRLTLPPVVWPKLVDTFEHEGRAYRIRPIDTPDIPAVAALYSTYYPHLYKSSRHYLLGEAFYREEACLLSSWQEDAGRKAYFMGLIETADTGEAIFAFGSCRELYDRAIQNLAIVLKPEYRGTFLTHHYLKYLEEVFRQSGVDYVYGTAQARDVIAQKLALKAGYKVGGIMPGAFRWAVDEDAYYRDMLVYMYKFYNGSEAYSTKPEDWCLDEEVKRSLIQLL
jgi:RimJ/RimL family protein N-acetyltransferase